MDELAPPARSRSSDIKCLRCGAFNIPENHVCGQCGASLPLVYDEEGNVLNLREDPRFQKLLNARARPKMSPMAMGWILRFGVIFFALLLAFWMLRHR